MKYLFIYRLTTDSGFAPCVQDGLLSLACCKGGQIRNGKPCSRGLRYDIGRKKNSIDYSVDDVYIMGVYKNKFLYLAKIKDAPEMTEYFGGMSKGRLDDIYSVKNSELIRNRRLRKENIHSDTAQNIKDIAGKYALLSDDYIYLGKDAVIIEKLLPYYPKFQETLKYKGADASKIIKECEKYRDNKIHTPNDPLKKKCQKQGCEK